MNLSLNCPINNLSFGNVSFNILRELYKKNIKFSLFPMGERVDVSAFNKADKNFLQALQTYSDNRYSLLDAQNGTGIKLWHIAGAENRLCKKQYLYTFHETTFVTPIEVAILNCQDKIFVSNKFSKDTFVSHGVKTPVVVAPLGFDPDLYKTNKIYKLNDKIHYGLMGKFEYRKNTARIIKAWAKIFGNNNKYQLTCVINNPFLDKNALNNELSAILEGKLYNNINFLPHMVTNDEVNDYLNSIDIDLGGLSGGEGWNLPSFNATALGKWSVVMAATAHNQWANAENSILINPSRLKDAHDGIFFLKGQPFNQGCFFDISDAEMENIIQHSANYAKKPNPKGEELRQKFTYNSLVETLLHECEK